MAKCHYCKRRTGSTKDHIIPKALGGPNRPWNYVPACPPCNAEKANKYPTCECDKCGLARRLFSDWQEFGIEPSRGGGTYNPNPVPKIRSRRRKYGNRIKWEWERAKKPERTYYNVGEIPPRPPPPPWADEEWLE